MIRRRLAVLRKSRVGGDRFDAQQRKQALQAVVEIGINTIENRLKLDVWHLHLPHLLFTSRLLDPPFASNHPLWEGAECATQGHRPTPRLLPDCCRMPVNP